MISIRVQPGQAIGRWVNVVHLDTLIDDGTFYGRRGRRRDYLDVVTPIGENVGQISDMDLFSPDKRRIELREHQDAHDNIRSQAAGSWST
jgi:hypothetical protein